MEDKEQVVAEANVPGGHGNITFTIIPPYPYAD